MTNPTLLEYKHHKDLNVDTARLAEHIADQRMMPIVISEFQNAAIHFPIMLTKNAETGGFVCTAVFGFDVGENLFWNKGEWSALYTPLNVRRQPFFVGNRNEGEGEDDYVLCIDEASPSLNKDGNGEALFDDSGEPSAYLKQAQQLLKDLLQGEAETKGFVNKILELDLVTPLSLDITFNNQETQRVDGAYSISEEKLAKLSDAQILELHKLGYMGLIYTMFVSLGQLYPLIERKNKVLGAADSWFQAANS